MTQRFHFILIESIDEFKPRSLSDPGFFDIQLPTTLPSFSFTIHLSADLSEPPHSWCIVPQTSSSNIFQILLACGDTVILLDANEYRDQQLFQGPFLRLAYSSNGKFVSFFTANGTVMVMSSDFHMLHLEFPSKSRAPPIQMNWF